jgi:hypothetical protein
LVMLFFAPWYILIPSIPIAVFNLRCYMRKEHRVYFISKKEYQGKLFSKMENQFKYKAAYYGVLTATTLVMMILALIDFMEKLI